jgi:uncharacterized protein YbaR (Trm112 family)
MSEVECPLCHNKISHLNVERDGRYAWGFCPKCKGELTEKQVKKLNKDYKEQVHP